MIVEEMEPMTYKRWAEGHWFRGMRFDTADEVQAARRGWEMAALKESVETAATREQESQWERVRAKAAAAELGGRFRSVLMELEQIMIEADIEHYDRPSNRSMVQVRIPEEARRRIIDFVTGGDRNCLASWSTDGGILYSGIEVTFGPPWDA